jgi:hypothetical protein
VWKLIPLACTCGDYKRLTTDHICHIREVVEAPAPRWTFEVGMREAAREALVVL